MDYLGFGIACLRGAAEHPARHCKIARQMRACQRPGGKGRTSVGIAGFGLLLERPRGLIGAPSRDKRLGTIGREGGWGVHPSA